MNLFNPTKRAEIIARLNLLTPESKALWGKMSVGEMLCHCLDGNKMALGEIPPTGRKAICFRSVENADCISSIIESSVKLISLLPPTLFRNIS